MIDKSLESSGNSISLNKFLKKVANFVNPIISSREFWQIVKISQTPVQTELSVFPEVPYTPRNNFKRKRRS